MSDYKDRFDKWQRDAKEKFEEIDKQLGLKEKIEEGARVVVDTAQKGAEKIKAEAEKTGVGKQAVKVAEETFKTAEETAKKAWNASEPIRDVAEDAGEKAGDVVGAAGKAASDVIGVAAEKAGNGRGAQEAHRGKEGRIRGAQQAGRRLRQEPFSRRCAAVRQVQHDRGRVDGRLHDLFELRRFEVRLSTRLS